MSDHERAIFGDHIFKATDLQRRCGIVLDAAKEGPVTITRNKDAYALMTRDKAKALMDDTELVAARATIADLKAQIAEKTELLEDMIAYANATFDYWDTDQDSKVGKRLNFMSGHLPTYEKGTRLSNYLESRQSRDTIRRR